MSQHVPVALRRQVWERASGLCEYCLLHERDDWVGFQIEHIRSKKHGGRTALPNLALACLDCNVAKGTDLGSVTRATGMLIPFFHPRRDKWSAHFQLHGHRIVPLTETGEVTCRILGFNSRQRLLKRKVIAMSGQYPSIEALVLLRE
jgi:hypothetical protein